MQRYWNLACQQDLQRIQAFGEYLDKLRAHSMGNEQLLREALECVQVWHRLTKTDDEPVPGLPLLLERLMLSNRMLAIMRDRNSTPDHKRMAAVLRKSLRSMAREPFSGLKPPARVPFSGLQLAGRPLKGAGSKGDQPLLQEALAHLVPIWRRFSSPQTRKVSAPAFLNAIASDSLFRKIPPERLPSLSTLKSPSLYRKRLARFLAGQLADARKR